MHFPPLNSPPLRTATTRSRCGSVADTFQSPSAGVPDTDSQMGSVSPSFVSHKSLLDAAPARPVVLVGSALTLQQFSQMVAAPIFITRPGQPTMTVEPPTRQ